MLILQALFPPPHALLTSELVIVLTHFFGLTDWIFKEKNMWRGLKLLEQFVVDKVYSQYSNLVHKIWWSTSNLK